MISPVKGFYRRMGLDGQGVGALDDERALSGLTAAELEGELTIAALSSHRQRRFEALLAERIRRRRNRLQAPTKVEEAARRGGGASRASSSQIRHL